MKNPARFKTCRAGFEHFRVARAAQRRQADLRQTDHRGDNFTLRKSLRDAVKSMQNIGLDRPTLLSLAHDAAIGQLRHAAKSGRGRQIAARPRPLMNARRDQSLPCSIAAIFR